MTESRNKAVSHGDHEVSDPSVLIKAPLVSVLMLAYNHGPYYRSNC